jgi:REP element-mobilizing transposase RayT
MSNFQTDRNRILEELIKLAEKPEHIHFLIELSTDKQVEHLKRIEELKKENYVLKNQRDWMLNKILERVNRN